MDRGGLISVGFLAVYFIVILWAAFFTKTGKMKEDSIEEFAVGGRSFGSIIILFTMVGLFITGSVFASFGSWAATDGLFVQYVLVYSVFGFVFTYVLARPIWILGRKHNLLTQADFFQLRYKSRFLTTVMGLTSVVIEAFWVIIEFAALGYMMEAITNGYIPHKIGTIIIVVLIMGYILYSGMKAVAITELIQGLVSSVVILFGLVAMAYKLFGGFGPLYEAVMAVAPDNLTITNNGAYSYGHWASVCVTCSLAGMTWASYFTRIYTSASVRSLKKVSWMSGLINVVVCALLFVVCMGGILFPEVVEAAASETSFFVMAELAFGPWFVGFCAVVAVAAGMSLISVCMNSHVIVISENLIQPFSKNKQPDKLKLARYCTLGYGLVALALALLNLPELYNIAIFINECVVQIFPACVLGAYWSRANKTGATLGFFGGALSVIILNALGMTFFTFSGGMLGLAVNIILNLICGFVCPKDEGVDELFEEVRTCNEKSLEY